MNLITVSHYDFEHILKFIHKNNDFYVVINDYSHYIALVNFLLFYLKENLDMKYFDDVDYILSQPYLKDLNEPIASLTFKSRKLIRSDYTMSYIYALNGFDFIKPNGRKRIYENLIHNDVIIHRNVHDSWNNLFD